MIKPNFLKTLDKVNIKLTVIENMINTHIVKSEDKSNMMSLIKDIRNSTHYSTNDLSRQFLEHYEKYKSVIKSDKNVIDKDKSELSQLLLKYNLVAKYNKELYDEYKRIVLILSKLKKSLGNSKFELALFEELVKNIESVLTRNSCVSSASIKYKTEDSKCATELLKSHIANNLVR